MLLPTKGAKMMMTFKVRIDEMERRLTFSESDESLKLKIVNFQKELLPDIQIQFLKKFVNTPDASEIPCEIILITPLDPLPFRSVINLSRARMQKDTNYLYDTARTVTKAIIKEICYDFLTSRY